MTEDPQRQPRPVAPAAAPVPPRTGLVGEGLALAGSVGVNAVVGLVAWLVAARLMPAAAVGTASAFVSAFILVAGITGLNLGVALLRWLPGAGRRASALVWRCSAVVVVLSVVAACGYLLLPGSGVIFEAATGSASPSLVGWLLFALAAAAWSLFQLHDLALVGLGYPWWAPAKNVLASTARLVAMIVIGTALTSQLVVLAWVVPTVVCVVVIAVFAARRSRRVPDPPSRAGRLPGRREVVGFLAPTYVGQLAMSLLYYQVPLLVIIRFGTEAGAAFFVAWQAVTVLDVVAFRFVNALVGQVSRHPDRAVELSRLARIRLLQLGLPALVAGILLAGPALAVFGPDYVVAAPALRVLLVGAAFRLLVVHALGMRQALGDALGFAGLQLVTTLVVLVGMVLVPADAASTEPALLRIAVVYLVAQVAFAVPQLLPRGSGSATAVQRRVAARAARRAGTVTPAT